MSSVTASMPATVPSVVPSRLPALVVLLVLAAGLAVAVLLTTPWHPLSGAIPGGPAAVDPARDFTPAQMSRAAEFHRAVNPPAYAGLAVGLLVAAVLGLTSLGARLIGAVSSPLGGGFFARVVVGGLAVLLAGRIATIGFSAWGEVGLRRFGLSTQGWGGWLADQAKGFGLTVVLAVLALLAVFGLVRAFPRHWWVPVGLGAAALVIGLSFVYPLIVEPIFNKFTPMPAGPLRSELLDLAARDHVPVKDVLVADASRRTTASNAYVSGFGSTRRIVVYDTLLKTATPEEVTVIVAHELGHAKRNDVLHGTLEGALAAGAGVVLLYLLVTWEPLLHRAGVVSMRDPRALALVLFLAALLSQLAAPASNLVSRHIESRADVHALELTRDPQTFAESMRSLAVQNLSSLRLNPVVYAFFATHPTPPERIATARSWAKLHGVPVPNDLAPTTAPRQP